MLRLTVLWTVLTLGVAAPASWARAEAPPAPARGLTAMVASAHPLATAAGQRMLARGGNVVDAAVAVSLALSVVEPWSSGVGGGAFMVLHLDGATTTWDMRETAPAAATRDMFVRDGQVVAGESTTSPRAAAIPGLVRGLAAVHARHGKLPFADTVAPAIAYARDGIPVTRKMHAAITASRDDLNPAARAIFLTPAGAPRPVGSRLVQADLARTLEAIARTGGEAFYTGEVAAELVRAVRAEGGLWTTDDLAGYRAVEREPVRGRYRGREIVSMGPPSSGGLLLVQMLGVLERFDMGAWSLNAPRRLHVLAEAMKRAYVMRAGELGDPDHAQVDRASFIGPEVLERLANEVRAADRATPAEALSTLQVHPDQKTHTSHFGVLTAAGDAVAMTQTINLTFGSGRVAGATGVMLNNEMDDFSALPGAPNAFGLVGTEANSVAPGKRPLSSMTPTLVLDGARAVGAFGTPGGSRIITTTLQTLLNVLDHGLDAAAALAAPRVHHQWYPDEIRYEPGGLDGPTRAALEALGHTPRERAPMGNAMVLWRAADGVLTGAADPRGEGAAGGL